jgi:ribonuclease HII
MASKNSIYEMYDWKSVKPHPCIGVDEAGRGCLAGPVYAGAVIIDESKPLIGITDSKLISESRREEIFEEIMSHHRVGIGFATAKEIDQINILNASFLAMRRAIKALGVTQGHVLVDGNLKIRELFGFQQTPLVKGDLRAHPISAGSIIAKVSRDRYMRKLAEVYPQYGFERHKGYSTADHKASVAKFGPCAEHRSSFAGVREHWPSQSSQLVAPQSL